MAKSDDCASGLHEFCGPCDCPCHDENKAVTSIFTIEEIKGLWKVLQYKYIPHENTGAHAAVDRIMRLLGVKKDETVRTNTSAEGQG